MKALINSMTTKGFAAKKCLALFVLFIQVGDRQAY